MSFKILGQLYKLKFSRKQILIGVTITYAITLIVAGILKSNPSIIISFVTLAIIPLHIFSSKRMNNLDYYYIGIDLDSNSQGDKVEIYCYAFDQNSRKIHILGYHVHQYNTFFDLDRFDEFVSKVAGCNIVENKEFNIRTFDIEFTSYSEVAKAIKGLRKSLGYYINQNQNALAAEYLSQPIITPPSKPRKLFRFRR